MAGNDLASREEVADLIRGRTLIPVEDSAEAQYSIAEDILAADDLGALFKERKSIAARDLVGVALRINSVKIRASTLEGKQGNYLLIDAVLLDTGEVIVMNTGAPNIVALLLRAAQLGVLPLEVVVAEAAKATPGRNAPLTLRPIGATLEAMGAAPAK